MTSSREPAWQMDGKTDAAIALPMARTERTYERTNERLQDSSKSAAVPDASGAVDNRVSRRIGDVMAEHELIGLDGSGATCSCGDRPVSMIEHLGDVALVGLNAPPSRRRLEVVVTEEDVARTREVLRERAAESDALTDEVNATGLVSFVDRSEWLIEHRRPIDALAWDLKWARLGLQPPYLPAGTNLTEMPGAIAYLNAPRRRRYRFTERQMQIAVEALERQEASA